MQAQPSSAAPTWLGLDLQRVRLSHAWLVLALLLCLVCFWLDPLVSLAPPKGRRYGDWHGLLRSLGYLPTWLVFGAVLCLHGQQAGFARKARCQALFVLGQAALSGALAALLKILVRRHEPPREGGYPGWVFEPLGAEPWRGSDLSFPSEHAAVAFGALIALSRLFPGAAPLLLVLGIGASIGRVQARGHYPSDVAMSLVVALGMALALEALSLRLAQRRQSALDGQTGAGVTTAVGSAELHIEPNSGISE
jgi:membrane-associated phospholipid phosphatase